VILSFPLDGGWSGGNKPCDRGLEQLTSGEGKGDGGGQLQSPMVNGLISVAPNKTPVKMETG
jgi:hypothetical protein